MSESAQHYLEDIQNVQSLEIVPSILELICRSTGMGFSAVARVTDSKWIACAVKDDIDFGLKPGGELQLETTICNEIRGHGQPVVIDDVLHDDQFRDHHTPKMYGFRSYISIPIFLKNGAFFGTLCAIDPRPFSLRSSKMVTMFNLYADLISYHLQTLEQAKAEKMLLTQTETKLQHSLNDIRQYAHISSHTLQEPLRKLRLFSDMITVDSSLPPDHNVKRLAIKINSLAADFATMIRHLSDYTETSNAVKLFQVVDLNETISAVISDLRSKIQVKRAAISVEQLGNIPGLPDQLYHLFYHVIDNALSFSRPDTPPLIKIYSRDVTAAEFIDLGDVVLHRNYCSICIEDNGIGIEKDYLEQIFNLFTRLHPQEDFPGLGMGLSKSRKIIQNHYGAILVDSTVGVGSTFSLIFPRLQTDGLHK